MLRVALVAPSVFAINNKLDYGGNEVCVLNLCEEMKVYCEVTLIAPKGSYIEGINIIETVEPKMTWGQDEAAYEIYKDRLGEFNLIHSLENLMLVYRYKQAHPETKICHTLQGIQTLPTLQPVPEPNLIALSQFHAEECRSRYGGQYTVIPHGIDLSKYAFAPEKGDYLLHLGLIAPHKGHDITFKLAFKGAKVIIAGEDRFVPDEGYVKMVKENCRNLGIEYLGPVTLEKKIELIQKARAVLLPFHVGEAFSLIAIESLACGTPVITSRIGAMPEIITDGQDGFLCNDLEDFKKAVNSIDTLKPSNCRAKAEAQFDRKLMAKRYFNFYQELTGDKKIFDSNFYNREYFEGSSKSGYGGMYKWELEAPKNRLIANFLESCFRGPILDVGCAYGFLCAALQDAGVEARGIDISEYSIANAVSRVKDKLSVYDVTLGTPFKNREFPTVVAFQTMEHIPIDKIPLVVKEMCRISDEYVVLEVPTWYDDKTPDRSDTFDKSHISFYSASFWVNQFYSQGFYLDVNLSHKLKGTDSSRLIFYRGDNVPARLKDDFKVTRAASEAEVKEIWEDHYGVPKGYELPQAAQVKVGAAALKIMVISSTVFPVPAKGYSGLEQLCYEWAVEFQKAGHKVALVAPNGSTVPEGMELIPTALMVDESQAYPLYKGRLGEFDVIMDNSWLWYTVIAQIEAGDRQLPVIHIYHSDPDFLPNPPPIKYPCLVGLSKEHARKIKEKWGVEVKPVYNGIPLDFYQFKPEVKGNGRYLWCARYTPEKMPLETIRLAKKCGSPLDLYGNTSIIRDQNYLNQCMAECDATNIVFHLEAPREETVKLYQNHKALIHLVNFNEAFGLVPVEAMACGMPVIVNRRGALPELVEDGVSGFVVDTIEQAEEIIKSGKVDTIKPEDCRKRAEMFSIEKSAQGYLALFREIASGRVW